MRYIRVLRIIFLIVLFIVYISSCKVHKDIFTSVTKKQNELKDKYASILNVNAKEIKNDKLYSLIDNWYGTPYKYGGIDKNGIDCSGFISIIYNNVYNKNVPRSTADLFTFCASIAKEELKEGDLVFFKIEKEKPSHVGMYLINNKFVHASTKKGIMISDLQEAYFIKYFYAGARLKK